MLRCCILRHPYIPYQAPARSLERICLFSCEMHAGTTAMRCCEVGRSWGHRRSPSTEQAVSTRSENETQKKCGVSLGGKARSTCNRVDRSRADS